MEGMLVSLEALLGLLVRMRGDGHWVHLLMEVLVVEGIAGHGTRRIMGIISYVVVAEGRGVERRGEGWKIDRL